MKNILILLFFLPFCSLAQKHDNVWIFGYESMSSTEGIEGSVGTFIDGNLEFINQPIGLQLSRTNGVISDIEGDLLFYTNGCEIANADHEIMENGEGINPGEVHDVQCDDWYTSGAQSCLILPKPESASEYYLFHKHIIYTYEPQFDVVTDKLLYTTIDIELNDGKGAVVEKNQIVVDSILTHGQLTAVKHANGIDWWLLNGGDENNKYYSAIFTENGIEGVFEQEIGDSTSHEGAGGGGAVFSPDGRIYVRYSAHDGIYLFDFDRETGLLSDFQHMPVPEIENVISGGVAISPNSRYLYVSHTVELYQYDLQAEDIEASKILIDTFDGFQSPFGTLFYTMQLGPDCRIYMTSQNGTDRLHVINNPDEGGTACNFEQHGIELPHYQAFSIPTFPNYRLGALIEGVDPDPPCELVVDVEEPEYPVGEQGENIYIFPNPASSYFKVAFEQELSGVAEVFLYDALGRKVLSQKMSKGIREFNIPLDGVQKGLYFYEVIYKGQKGKSGKLVVM